MKAPAGRGHCRGQGALQVRVGRVVPFPRSREVCISFPSVPGDCSGFYCQPERSGSQVWVLTEVMRQDTGPQGALKNTSLSPFEPEYARFFGPAGCPCGCPSCFLQAWLCPCVPGGTGLGCFPPEQLGNAPGPLREPWGPLRWHVGPLSLGPLSHIWRSP